MLIECSNCFTRYTLPDDKISKKGVSVRCSKCQHIFTVKAHQPAPPSTSDARAETAPAVEAESQPPVELEPPPAEPDASGPISEDPPYGASEPPTLSPLSEAPEEPPHPTPESPLDIDFEIEVPETEPLSVDFGEQPAHREPDAGEEAIPPVEDTLTFEDKEALLLYSPSPVRWIAAVLAAAFIAGAVYYLVVSQGTHPRLARTFSMLRKATEHYLGQDIPTILRDKTKGRTLESDAHGHLLIIEGLVKGTSPSLPPPSVRATLFDMHGKAIRQAGAVCGNVLSLDALESLARDAALHFLAGNRAPLPGGYPQEEMSSVTVGAAGTTPFMIVFFDLPAEDTEFEVEIVR